MRKTNFLLFSCLLALTLISFSSDSRAAIYTIDITMSGLQEVPANPSTATGILVGTYDDVTRVLDFDMIFNGLSAPTTAAHFHGPAAAGVNAPIQIGFAGFPVGVTSGSYSNTYVLTATQDAQIVAGLWYVNVHTSLFPGGEIRGQLTEGTLPVELSSFTSFVNRNNVQLNWTTLKETNNAGFEIERKATASSEWTKAGYISGNGNSVGVRNFSYTERVSTGLYNYRLKQIDFNGNFEYFSLSNDVNVGVPTAFNLSQNYPNPFNPSTRISYDLPFDGNAIMKIFDMSGKEVYTLINEFQTAGYYTVDFNASNLSSGIYYYTLTSGNSTFTKKMMLVK